MFGQVLPVGRFFNELNVLGTKCAGVRNPVVNAF